MNEEIKNLLIKEYGFNTGFRIASLVLPNIIADFKKKLMNSLVGSSCSEEYRFDDMEGSIILKGTRISENECAVTGATIAGIEVPL